MSARYYDVVVLGADLAPLTCAALLAKRGFRVLVLGHEDDETSYAAGKFSLPRRLFQPSFGNSPVSQRIIVELGFGTSLRRPPRSKEPAFQIAVPGHRFDVPYEDAELARTFEREFPEVRRPIEDFHAQVDRVTRGLDSVFSQDLVVPPETFFERQRFARARRAFTAQLQPAKDALAEFPEGHLFRQVATLPARFEAAVDPDQFSELRLLRLYGNCRRGTLIIDNGIATLRNLFVQKINAHSGRLCFDERVGEILVQKNEAVGVRLTHSGDEIACGYVVVGADVNTLARWLPDRNMLEPMFERVGEPMTRHYRFTLNLVMRRQGIPAGFGRNLYFLSESSIEGAGLPMRLITQALDADHTLICAEALLPARKVEEDPEYISTVRAKHLRALRELLPFLEEHLVLIDSPHDGHPPEGEHKKLDPFQLARRGPTTMPPVYSYPLLSHLGLCALPVRSPIKRLLLCNSQLIPTVGSEGQLLAACSTARVITWADRSRSWMRRRLWAKAEM